MIYIVEVDGTICNSNRANFKHAIPVLEKIEQVNDLYDDGHTIIYWANRSKRDWEDVTYSQLGAWGCRYDCVVFGQPLPSNVPVAIIT